MFLANKYGEKKETQFGTLTSKYEENRNQTCLRTSTVVRSYHS